MTDRSITDGKRSVTVTNGSDGIDITICRNGYQSVVVTVDAEMLGWLASMIAPQWQPIETAPKDGTPVIVYPPLWRDVTISMACFDMDRGAVYSRPFWRHLDADSAMSRDNQPTHWMPMPEPPEVTE